MKYSFRAELYDSIDDVLDDVHQNEFIYNGYLREALNEFPPFTIFDGICGGDFKLANKIRKVTDDLIIQDIEVRD